MYNCGDQSCLHFSLCSSNISYFISSLVLKLVLISQVAGTNLAENEVFVILVVNCLDNHL